MRQSLLVFALMAGGVASCFAIESNRTSYIEEGKKALDKLCPTAKDGKTETPTQKFDANGKPIPEEKKVEEVKKSLAKQHWENTKDFGSDVKELGKKHPFYVGGLVILNFLLGMKLGCGTSNP